MDRAVGVSSLGSESRFFIAGCQRTGTTLMRLILECHSQVRCCDESTSYNVLRGLTMPPCDARLLGLKVPCITEQMANVSLWDYYLIREGLRNEYSGQRIIFMVRDVRDTVRSMQQLRIDGEPWNGMSWFEGYLIPSLRAKVTNEARFRARYGEELALMRKSRHMALARAAFYWRYKTESFMDYLQLGYPMLLVRYEDLVSQPRVELLRVCGFLQIPWEEQLLEHEGVTHPDLREDGFTIGGTDPGRSIDRASVGRWRGDFDDEQLAEILRFAGGMQSALYLTGAVAAPAAAASV